MAAQETSETPAWLQDTGTAFPPIVADVGFQTVHAATGSTRLWRGSRLAAADRRDAAEIAPERPHLTEDREDHAR